MDLSNLKPAEGSTKKPKNELEEDRDQAVVVHQPEDIKEPNPVQGTKETWVSKEVRCLCTEGFRNSVSKISTGWNIKVLILMFCRNLPINNRVR